MTQNIVPTVNIPIVSISAPLGSPLAAAILDLVAAQSEYPTKYQPAQVAAPAEKQAKPAKPAKPAPVEDEAEETEDDKTGALTSEAVVAQTRDAAAKIGVPALKAILKKFNKARASELEPKQFAAYLKALNEATDTL